MTKKTWRRIALAATGFAAVLLIALAIVFQDGIARFLATPRAPFQASAPPPAPDYVEASAWLVRPAPGQERAADLFYIHSTAYYSREAWNASIDDADSVPIREMILAPNEAGPFSTVAAVYGPKYREATLYARFTHKYDGLAARELAYSDVKRAFDAFLAGRDRERPLIIAGYGQGGVYALGLLGDYFQGAINPLRRRLVAAYVIGASTPKDYLAALDPPLPVCEGPEAVRCVVSYVDFEERFDEEMQRLRDRALIWRDGDLVSIDGGDLVCVNPLTWRAGGGYAPPAKNIGAASATGIAPGAPPPAIAKAVGARCENGVLIVDDPERRFLRRGDWFGAKWKAQPFNLFYYDLAKNAEERLAALQARLKVEPEPLEPIAETIDVDESPVNKVPH